MISTQTPSRFPGYSRRVVSWDRVLDGPLRWLALLREGVWEAAAGVAVLRRAGNCARPPRANLAGTPESRRGSSSRHSIGSGYYRAAQCALVSCCASTSLPAGSAPTCKAAADPRMREIQVLRMAAGRRVRRCQSGSCRGYGTVRCHTLRPGALRPLHLMAWLRCWAGGSVRGPQRRAARRRGRGRRGRRARRQRCRRGRGGDRYVGALSWPPVAHLFPMIDRIVNRTALVTEPVEPPLRESAGGPRPPKQAWRPRRQLLRVSEKTSSCRT